MTTPAPTGSIDLSTLDPHGAPLALARLALGTPPGARVAVRVPDRGGWWQDEILVDDVLVGAGFGPAVRPPRQAMWTERQRSLPDTVGPGMRVLVVGLNPSLRAADSGVGYVSPSNRFWPAARDAGLVTTDRDPIAALVDHGTGMTDLVKRATRRADELSPDEYRAGLARLSRLCERLRPGVVCVVGLAGWRAAVDRRAVPGPQLESLGGRPVYVLPSTSGLNARIGMDDLTAHLAAALRVAATRTSA